MTEGLRVALSLRKEKIMYIEDSKLPHVHLCKACRIFHQSFLGASGSSIVAAALASYLPSMVAGSNA